MSIFQKLKFFVGFPILGFAISVGAMFVARLSLFFILRPLAKGMSSLAEQYTPGNLRTTFSDFTGIGWLDFIIPFIFAGLFFIFARVLASPLLEEIGKIFPILIQISFGYLGAFWVNNGFLLGNQAVYIILVPLVLFVCFFNTILDYHTFTNAIQSGDLTNIAVNIFSDRFTEAGEITQADSVIIWMVQDNVSVNNFFDYWFYSLRSSILSYRFEGRGQVFAFLINLVGSILFFVVGYYAALYSYNQSIKKTLESLKANPNEAPSSNEVSTTLAFLIAVILSAFGFWWIFSGSTTNLAAIPTILHPFFSFGEKSFVTGATNQRKQDGVQAFAQGNFEKAVSSFQDSLSQNRNDPETLIYLNNAKIGVKNSYTLAVVVPFGQNANAANEILRGVAQAQNAVNSQGGINGIPLRVLIADDYNKASAAAEIATELVKIKSVLGVIGHFSSEATLVAGQVYQDNGLTLISPTASSTAIANLGNYVFRTVPSDALGEHVTFSVSNYA